MWIAVCDNCKNPTIFVARNKEESAWTINNGQDKAIHACSRACAEHLDRLPKFRVDTEAKSV